LNRNAKPHDKSRKRPAKSQPAKGPAPFVIFLALLAWALPLAWVSAIPAENRAADPELETRKRLLQSERLIQLYMKEFDEAPSSLADLKIFAHGTSRPFDSHDGFGDRFDYLRLDAQHYILRSYGKDGVQNTLMSQADEAVFKSGKLPQQGLTYTYSRRIAPHWYPAILLLGSDSPNHVWFSRLFVDAAAGTRRLLVRHHERKDLHMFAPHDAVEEFLWMPNGYQIVFTASGSARYRDGIFLWNLLDDSSINLIELVQKEYESRQAAIVSASDRGDELAFALAGIFLGHPQDSPVAMAYIAQRAGGTIDPHQFFNKESLVLIKIPEGKAPPALLAISEREKEGLGTPISHDLNLDLNIGDREAGSKSQQVWLKLPLSGGHEQMLEQWQDFVEKQAGSPLFPYGLWYLSSLYAEVNAHAALKAPEDPSVEVLRGFGVELAKAMAQLPLAPTYIRGLATYSVDRLMKNESLPYSFINGGNVTWNIPNTKPTQ